MSARSIAVALLLSALLVPSPAGAAQSVKGKWRGQVTLVKGGNGSFPVVMRISRLVVGQRAGALRNPGSPCHGPIQLLSRNDGRYAFRYHEASAAEKCTGDDRIVVHRSGPDLRWRGVSPDHRVVGKGLLHRA